MSAPKEEAFDSHYIVQPVRYDAIGALIILRAEVTGRDESTYRFYSDGLLMRRKPREATTP
jgi:hypothetical protein